MKGGRSSDLLVFQNVLPETSLQTLLSLAPVFLPRRAHQKQSEAVSVRAPREMTAELACTRSNVLMLPLRRWPSKSFRDGPASFRGWHHFRPDSRGITSCAVPLYSWSSPKTYHHSSLGQNRPSIEGAPMSLVAGTYRQLDLSACGRVCWG